MVLADVNVLVYALRSDVPQHDLCRRWLDQVLNGDTPYGMSPQVLSAVIRITTNGKIFRTPNSLGDVLRACARLLDPVHCVVIQPGERHWPIFTRLCRQADAMSNLVTDAWFAALAIEWGCEWITLDRDFARFPDLSWRTPG
jgi:toxin-antitoxin system PIN domain toxin